MKAYSDPQKSFIKKRSITLARHKTSVSVEESFWEIIEAAAKEQMVPLAHIIIEIDTNRVCSLSSAIRLFALDWIKNEKNEK